MKGTKYFFHFRSPVPHPFHQVPASEPLRLHEIHELPDVNPFKSYPGAPYPTPVASSPSVASYPSPSPPSPSPIYPGNGYGPEYGYATPTPAVVAPVSPAAHPIVPFRTPKSLFNNHFSYLLPRA